ncbi:hypothetical protein [Rufibacter sp. LB8]|uniref:hypothetical protein n=1 Tax=Rufibacter sp. LB8 TaxID=2777781 RepID=UPI00178C7B43|nr:hypothetical protein [Rufibacter sp. LB8]
MAKQGSEKVSNKTKDGWIILSPLKTTAPVFGLISSNEPENGSKLKVEVMNEKQPIL